MQLNGVRMNSLSSSLTIKATTKFVTAAPPLESLNIQIWPRPGLVSPKLSLSTELHYRGCYNYNESRCCKIVKVGSLTLLHSGFEVCVDAFELHTATA